jgi:hypothetical protein
VGLKILEILALWQRGPCEMMNCRHHTSNEGVDDVSLPCTAGHVEWWL